MRRLARKKSWQQFRSFSPALANHLRLADASVRALIHPETSTTVSVDRRLSAQIYH